MKKFAIILFICLAILSTSIYVYKTYENKLQEETKYESEIDKYNNKNLAANEMASLINLLHKINTENNVEYDEDGFSISSNAIKMYISFKESDELIDSESIYIDGVDRFAVYYDDQEFRITQIEKTNNVISTINAEQVK